MSRDKHDTISICDNLIGINNDNINHETFQ